MLLILGFVKVVVILYKGFILCFEKLSVWGLKIEVYKGERWIELLVDVNRLFELLPFNKTIWLLQVGTMVFKWFNLDSVLPWITIWLATDGPIDI
jgi:hypothetical protein